MVGGFFPPPPPPPQARHALVIWLGGLARGGRGREKGPGLSQLGGMGCKIQLVAEKPLRVVVVVAFGSAARTKLDISMEKGDVGKHPGKIEICVLVLFFVCKGTHEDKFKEKSRISFFLSVFVELRKFAKEGGKTDISEKAERSGGGYIHNPLSLPPAARTEPFFYILLPPFPPPSFSDFLGSGCFDFHRNKVEGGSNRSVRRSAGTAVKRRKGGGGARVRSTPGGRDILQNFLALPDPRERERRKRSP